MAGSCTNVAHQKPHHYPNVAIPDRRVEALPHPSTILQYVRDGVPPAVGRHAGARVAESSDGMPPKLWRQWLVA